jgi:hypothetical protein
MNLQRLIEQYISYKRSLGLLFVSDAALLRALVAHAVREPALPVFAFGMWMRSWAKPGQ